ncbi:hypothetical protein O9992_09065 [Vibrio lentus]|nr:hypothetical protein [Vibrio lentus]
MALQFPKAVDAGNGERQNKLMQLDILLESYQSFVILIPHQLKLIEHYAVYVWCIMLIGRSDGTIRRFL